ncbi:MAG: diguanylate cyclase, partial [Spirochaetia bacterium]|nr:diguanylate cyclase [Spirochaetia bacterium]
MLLHKYNKLTLRITGIVFWGMVLVGLLLSFILLQGREEDIYQQNKGNAGNVFHLLEIFLRSNKLPYESEEFSRDFIHKANSIQEDNFQSIKFIAGDVEITTGEIKNSYYSFSYIRYDPLIKKNSIIKIYFKSIDDEVSRQRKITIIVIGLVVTLFGLILQKILQKIITVPLWKMLDDAILFAEGNEFVRFNENRNDEFGFLAKFINGALEAVFKEKERNFVTLQSITDSVITVDSDGLIQYLNPAGEKLFESSSKDLEGKHVNDILKLIEENTLEKIPNPFQASIQTKSPQILTGHTAILRENGKKVSVEVSSAPMYSQNNKIMGAVIVIQDVSKNRKLTRQLSYQASHDSLTGLYNRRKFEEKLSQVIQETDAGQVHNLIYMDLDQFKIVNDTCGHMAGDELLRQLAGIINTNLRKGDTFARLGGDEFGMLLENCNIENALDIAEKLRVLIKEYRFSWHDRSFEIGSSFGIATITSEEKNISKIMSAADLACYAAKES